MFLEILQILQESTCAESLFNKVADLRSATLLKRDCDTNVFLSNLQGFHYSFSQRTSPVAASACQKHASESLKQWSYQV